MNVAELLDQIKDLPQDTKIFVSSAGCPVETGECEGIQFFKNDNELWIYQKD